jgi:TM2 domain-containing membrane protein YozV
MNDQTISVEHAEIISKAIKDAMKHPPRDRIAAALLALFFGGLGLHHFYLGRPILGIIYILFCWTFIPMILGVVEFFLILMMDKSKLERY